MKNRIREFREQRGMTQEQLGNLVGTSGQAINAIETEKFEPSMWLAYDISCVFACSIEAVFFLMSARESQGRKAAGGTAMAIRELRYDGNPILRKQCREVENIDGRIRQILDDMMDTLHHTENSAALTANQVGILKRLVVIVYLDHTLKLIDPQGSGMHRRIPELSEPFCKDYPSTACYHSGSQ